MGMKVVKAEPEKTVKTKKAKSKKSYYITPIGVSSFGFGGNAEEDADTLVEAQAIKQDRSRYNAAKAVLRDRGL